MDELELLERDEHTEGAQRADNQRQHHIQRELCPPPQNPPAQRSAQTQHLGALALTTSGDSLAVAVALALVGARRACARA